MNIENIPFKSGDNTKSSVINEKHCDIYQFDKIKRNESTRNGKGGRKTVIFHKCCIYRHSLKKSIDNTMADFMWPRFHEMYQKVFQNLNKTTYIKTFPQCLGMNEWINKMWCIYTNEFYSN